MYHYILKKNYQAIGRFKPNFHIMNIMKDLLYDNNLTYSNSYNNIYIYSFEAFSMLTIFIKKSF